MPMASSLILSSSTTLLSTPLGPDDDMAEEDATLFGPAMRWTADASDDEATDSPEDMNRTRGGGASISDAIENVGGVAAGAGAIAVDAPKSASWCRMDVGLGFSPFVVGLPLDFLVTEGCCCCCFAALAERDEERDRDDPCDRVEDWERLRAFVGDFERDCWRRGRGALFSSAPTPRGVSIDPEDAVRLSFLRGFFFPNNLMALALFLNSNIMQVRVFNCAASYWVHPRPRP
mmetsp:Transcript_53529/g.113680  ORF Transcript_53529/g.113680 Transcript_53529/m.113680 type:complete len:232 (-) Transcript_53529:62-757(-)